MTSTNTTKMIDREESQQQHQQQQGGSGQENEQEEEGGCYICTLNNHQDQILLCEHCNGEYHIYCLVPPLLSVPEYDWYCDNCIEYDPLKKHLLQHTLSGKSNHGNETILQHYSTTISDTNNYDDGLERQVLALPYSITKRYGEIIFAQGGPGYGWWPCQIYNPCHAVDSNVRQSIQKQLYTKHLVYFFNCSSSDISTTTTNNSNNVTAAAATATTTTSSATTGNTNNHNTNVNNHSNNSNNNNNNNTASSSTGTVNPFSILGPNKIKTFLQGLSEDLYFGLAAKNHGKQRYRSFCDAFQLACIEYDKSSSMYHDIDDSSSSNSYRYSLLTNQQRRFILDTYVYSNTVNNRKKHSSVYGNYNDDNDKYHNVSTTAPNNSIIISPKKDVFLLPSPKRISNKKEDSIEKSNKNSNNNIEIGTNTTSSHQQIQAAHDDSVGRVIIKEENPKKENNNERRWRSEKKNNGEKIKWFRLTNQETRCYRRNRRVNRSVSDRMIAHTDVDDIDDNSDHLANNDDPPHPALAGFFAADENECGGDNVIHEVKISRNISTSPDKTSFVGASITAVPNTISTTTNTDKVEFASSIQNCNIDSSLVLSKQHIAPTEESGKVIVFESIEATEESNKVSAPVDHDETMILDNSAAVLLPQAEQQVESTFRNEISDSNVDSLLENQDVTNGIQRKDDIFTESFECAHKDETIQSIHIKRPRGRPKNAALKNMMPNQKREQGGEKVVLKSAPPTCPDRISRNAIPQISSATAANQNALLKKKRGRPKSLDKSSNTKPTSRKRGRPRKIPSDITLHGPRVKRGRGRPKKDEQLSTQKLLELPSI